MTNEGASDDFMDNINALTDLTPGERMDALVALQTFVVAEDAPWWQFRWRSMLRAEARDKANAVLSSWRTRHAKHIRETDEPPEMCGVKRRRLGNENVSPTCTREPNHSGSHSNGVVSWREQ